jgi:activator of HSP90 ATPase
MAKTLKLSRKIKGTPEEVYRAFTNPFTIQLWSDFPAVMEDVPDSEFSILDGAIEGKNIEFVKDTMIRQIWYFGEDGESEVTIRLAPDKGHTNVYVEQHNIPDDAYDNILEGWKESYLGAIKDFFEV